MSWSILINMFSLKLDAQIHSRNQFQKTQNMLICFPNQHVQMSLIACNSHKKVENPNIAWNSTQHPNFASCKPCCPWITPTHSTHVKGYSKVVVGKETLMCILHPSCDICIYDITLWKCPFYKIYIFIDLIINCTRTLFVKY